MRGIVCVDSNWGISKESKLPWSNTTEGKYDMRWFNMMTTGSYIIMGYNTYVSMNTRLLKDRFSIVIDYTSANTTNDVLTDHPVLYIRSISAAIDFCKAANYDYHGVYIIGGRKTFIDALELGVIDKLYVTIIGGDYDCDLKFPAEYLDEASYDVIKSYKNASIREYDIASDERKYLALCSRILRSPLRPNRTIHKTHSLYCQSLKFKLYNNDKKILPLLTVKRVSFHSIYTELIWFLRGDTTIKYLVDNNVYIWNDNSTRAFLDSVSLTDYPVGHVGPCYGSQWRSWGNRGIDQISRLIDNIKNGRNMRRLIVNAWNVQDLQSMALPPCHFAFQFYVDNDDRLCCVVFMRSADLPLGVPYNIVSYSLLLFMIAEITKYKAGSLYLHMTDCHIYENQVQQVNKMISRECRKFPTFEFSESVKTKASLCIDDFVNEFSESDFIVDNYNPHPYLMIPMAV